MRKLPFRPLLVALTMQNEIKEQDYLISPDSNNTCAEIDGENERQISGCIGN